MSPMFCIKCQQPIKFWSNQYHLPIHAACLTGEDEGNVRTDNRPREKNPKKTSSVRESRYNANRNRRN